MEQLKVAEFLEKNKEFLFPNKEYSENLVEEALLSAPDTFEYTMEGIPFKKPSTVKLIAFFPGSLGVDRFYLGDIAKGILKYFTFGGLGIWWITDMISAKDRCRAYNCKKLMAAVNDPSFVSQMQQTNAKMAQAGQIAKGAFEVGKVAAKGMSDIGKTFYIDN